MKPNHLIDPVSDCDAIRQLIPDHAFGLTDPQETHLVESNLAYCPEAAEQLADFRQIQAEMRASVTQIEPPAQLGERLIAAIAAPTATAQPRQQPFRRVSLIAAAAVIALIITNTYWLIRVNDLARRQSELAAVIAGLQSDQQNNAFVLTGTSDLRWVRLPPSQQNKDASAFLMWNAESKIGLLYARGFPKLVAGKTYQLWLTRGEEIVSAGTFQVDGQGNGALLFHILQPIDKYTWARITTEPENGSKAPTGLVVVIGKITI